MNQNDIKKESVPGIKPKYIEVYKFYDGNTDKWALGDSRNHLTTFFDNDMNLIPINDHTVMFIGEVEGDIDLYICDGQGFSKNTANMIVPCEGTIKDLKKINEEEALITTEEGKYIFNIANKRRCSSIYDDIFYVDNLWWFEKDIRVKGTTNKYLGNILGNGQIGEWLYEKTTGNFIPTPTYEEYDYTALDTEKIRKMLIKRLTVSYSETRQKRLELGRLNTAGRFNRE